MGRRSLRVRLLVIAALAAVCSIAKERIAPAESTAFVGVNGTSFTLAGKPFFVTGVNNHYLTFGTTTDVTRVLDDAVQLGANALRIYLQPVIGSLDGVMPTIWDWKKTGETN